MHTLESLFEEAARRADERFDDVLIRILTADIPEFVVPKDCCRKCGPLLTDYIRIKIALHRWNRNHDDWPHRPCGVEPGFVLRMRVEQARRAFHDDDCKCGLQLWRGRRWRERQGSSYMNAFQGYVSNKESRA